MRYYALILIAALALEGCMQTETLFVATPFTEVGSIANLLQRILKTLFCSRVVDDFVG